MQKCRLLIAAFVLLVSIQVSAQEIARGFDKIFTSYQVDSGFTGVVLLVKNDTVVLQKGYGFADDRTKTPNTAKTLFNVASVGKQFTAVTVLKLEEQGLLNTSDYVWKYVGKLGGLKDSATIQHLLLHNSGLFVEGYPLAYGSRDSFIASVSKSPIESKPGEKYRYSNAGYTLMAAIVEIVTKQRFEDVLYKMVFNPAGMTSTGYPWESRMKKNLMATGYNNKGEAMPAAENTWGNMGPGNILTNTEDMLQWYKVVWKGQGLISSTIKERMLTDYIPGRETFSWHKGKTPAGKRLYQKNGGRDDFQSQVMWWMDENVFLSFSINRDKDLRRYMYRDINAYMNRVEAGIQ